MKEKKKAVSHEDYTSSLYDSFKNKLDAMNDEEVGTLFEGIAEKDNRPKFGGLADTELVAVYEGSCNTHYITLSIRGERDIDDFINKPPFSLLKELDLKRICTLEHTDESYENFVDNEYDVIATFEPYEPEMFTEQENSFQIRLRTKEETVRQYLKSME